MLKDAVLANVLLGMGIGLTIIGLILWKILNFEIKGEEYYLTQKREQITEWIGENLLILGLFSTTLALLYKYSDWFSMIRTGIFIFFLGVAVIVRICSIEEVYDKTKTRDITKG